MLSVAKRIHTEGRKHPKIREVMIDTITTCIWNAGLVLNESDPDIGRLFLEQNFAGKILETAELLGEETYEEFFDEMSTICLYAFNAMIFSFIDDCRDY